MCLAYEARAVIVEDSLKDSGLLLARPKGAFYAMIDTSSTGMTDDRFVEALMAEEGVAVAPGDTFGQQAAGSIRVSLASAAIELSAGLSRIERFISKARQ
jgi:arginine:pyruvate transaminase